MLRVLGSAESGGGGGGGGGIFRLLLNFDKQYSVQDNNAMAPPSFKNNTLCPTPIKQVPAGLQLCYVLKCSAYPFTGGTTQ